MLKTILWDLDNTLLDFYAAESYSLKACFKKFGLGECSDEMVKRYSVINQKHWLMLEKGLLTKQDIMNSRFNEFFEKEGIKTDNLTAFNEAYELGIVDTIKFIENGYEIVKSLKEKFKQYAVTNGAAKIQRLRIKKSGLDRLFDGVFISDEVGFEKPSYEFFDFVKNNISPCEDDEIIIIGDSLTSDMKGANNSNIKCCWYNPNGNLCTDGINIDFEIKSLNEINNILTLL